jgi:PadR family transcriptional regulator, regulatory protein PadR
MAINSDNNGDRGEYWEAQLRKGCLEMAILASLWHGRLYGLEILRSLAESSRLEVAEGTLYPILSRLKGEGLLQSEWVEAEAGHPRKYYWLTAPGRRRAREMAGAWNEFAAKLAVLVEPVVSERNGSRERGR